MAEPILPPDERDALAAELALGVLEGEDLARALRLRLADADFAALVEAWQVRLAPLGTAFAEAPAPDIWPAIERRLGGADPVRPAAALRWWRFAALGAGALAASLAAVLVLRPLPAPVTIVRAPDQVAVAQLDGGEKGALLAARYDPGTGELRIHAVRMPDSRLAPELWVIPADGVPRSLGLVASSGRSQVTVPADRRGFMDEGATLAVTMEPRDGAPHQAPSSAPVAAGKISKI
jgi:anti-sigma-K factor RskA